jgi:hypothetical protein
METIIFKAPNGTKSKLREINPNISELLREHTRRLVRESASGSAYQKAAHLCDSLKGSRSASTGKAYLNQSAKKGVH